MIYIIKRNTNEIITDNVTNFIADNLDIYLDDVLIGTYINYSTSILYLRFDIPSSDIANLEERDYEIKIYNHKALIKKELVCIKSNSSLEIKTITNPKNIKFYE